MSADFSLDRAAFQEFLASAYAVQESQIDSRFLAAFLGVQRLVASGELGTDGVMTLVVDSAREVAGAAGVAIGLLEREQLIYRAGSGCSASQVGSTVAASLTVSEKTTVRREILRVENAHTDTRIEGAICRQFSAESLLILPIYRDRMLAGVLEILFSQAHTYQDCEVRMYRLMGGLVEEAMCLAAHAEGNFPAKLPVVQNAPDEMPKSHGDFTEERPILSFVNQRSIYERCGAAVAAIRRSPSLRRPILLAEMLVQRSTEAIAKKPIHSLALCAVITGFGLTFWMTHGGRSPASSWESSTPSRPAAEQTFQPDVIPVDRTSKGLSVRVPGQEARLATLRSRRARMGQPGVDYIGDDVTVRHFTYKPARQRAGSRVAYIGEDVTVRYFTPKPTVNSQTQ